MHFREDKSTQAASVFIKKAGGKMECLRLMKLLYLADRRMLLTYGDPITYDCWVLTDDGPALSETYSLIRPQGNYKSAYWKHFICTANSDVELTADSGTDELSVAEEQVILDVFAEYGELAEGELLEKMRALPEWEDPHGSSIPITIEKLLKVSNFSTDDITAIVENVGEQEVMYRVLESIR